MKTRRTFKKDEEFFASYGYRLPTGPKWYRELYRKFAKENPDLADESILKQLDELEDLIAKGKVAPSIVDIVENNNSTTSNSIET